MQDLTPSAIDDDFDLGENAIEELDRSQDRAEVQPTDDETSDP